MSWLTSISVLIALPLFALIFAVPAVVAHSLVRLFFSPERLSPQHEVAGFLMGVVGVLYSVVLGFLVGTVWTAFASAQQTSDLEAGYVADAFNFASHVPPAQRRELQRLIAQYALLVRNSAWTGVPPNAADSSGELLLHAVNLTLSLHGPPRTASQNQILEAGTIRTELLDSLRSIGDTRRLRLVQSESRLPPGMLEALILGAIFVIVFTFFFGVKSYPKQMIMTALLAGSIGLFFGLVVELSTPYSGAIQVSRDALKFVIENNRLEVFARRRSR
jgi:Protein of unknown function (DUF4239)